MKTHACDTCAEVGQVKEACRFIEIRVSDPTAELRKDACGVRRRVVRFDLCSGHYTLLQAALPGRVNNGVLRDE